MNRVERIVARYAGGESIKMGVVAEFPSQRLQEDLNEILRQNRTYFNLLFGLLVGIALLILALLFAFIREPQVAAGILAAGGISLPLLIRQMFLLWQAKTQGEVLIRMSTSLEPAMMRTVVKVLAQGLAIKGLPAR